MIPKNISRKHILQAIQRINKDGIPENRVSKKYTLIYLGRHYPPKYVIALANIFANGELLSSERFGGGQETNYFLESRGFEIGEKHIDYRPKDSQPRKKEAKPQFRHNERCPECKKTIEKMLKIIFGRVETNYRFDAGIYPEEYTNSPFYPDLQTIYHTLRYFRGHNEFIRTTSLPRVDYYIPDPGFIIEFDESQHFSASRKEALLQYPSHFEIGFELDKWITLCDTIDAKDNDPPFRDEQRAWYDTLRDFLPTIKQLQPTVRLFSKSFQWCSLDPNNISDQNRFKVILEGEKLQWEIEVHGDSDPSLGRIIIAGGWGGDVESSEQLLHDICDHWPTQTKVNFLITCGAFLTFEWPIELFNIGDNKFPDNKIINTLISKAEKHCHILLNEDLRKELATCTDYITIGIDSYKEKISLSNVSIRQPHVEMVALVDLESGRYHWTGKSYPTTGQENGLVRFHDLNTHFIETKMGTVILLGCHDLNIFSPRGKSVTREGWRKQVREDFYRLSKSNMPYLVLHHPHTTDSSRIWTAAWNELNKSIPSVESYQSAGRYYNLDSKQRSSVDDVRQKTKLGNSLDFIVWIKDK